MRDLDVLANEIALREASLADARREHAAGELDDDGLASIEARDGAALDAARAELARLEAEAPDATPTRRPSRRRRWLAGAALCFVLVIAILLHAALAPRQAGNSITGSVQLGHAQEITQLLTEAQADTANADDVAAVAAYQQVLSLDAANATALTQLGWLDFSAGSADHDLAVVRAGEAYLGRAVAAAPRNAAARLYYAIVADATPGNQALAKREFAVFLALHPSAYQRAVAKPFLAKLGLKG